MYAWETIEKTLHYVEDHLSEEIKTEELAEAAGLSKFYYQRLFKRLVHKPVQEYIKLRRLAKAVDGLKDTNKRIIDTALEYGFSDHANFTRAFKETYHITPEEYRKSRLMLNTFDKPEISAEYVMIDENVPLIIGSIVLEIQRKTLKEPEVFFGLKGEISIAEQIPMGESTGIDVPGELWRVFHEQKERISDVLEDNIELGMCYDADPEKGVFTYFAGGKAVSNEIGQCEGMVKQELPAGAYIVCRIEAPTFEELVTTALGQAEKYLFGTWLKNHNLSTQPFSAEKYYKGSTKVHSMEIWVQPL